MKKIFLVLLSATVLFTSCKKDDDNNCDETTAAVAGNYKVTKVVINGQDVTDSYLDDCTRSGVFALNANGTLNYTENASCSGDGTGTWSITGTTITASHSGNGDSFSGTVANNCSNITVTESENIGGVTFTYVATLTRQ